MKIGYFISSAAAGLLLLAGCRNALEYKPAIYITEAQTTDAMTMVVDGKGGSVSFTVTAAQPVKRDTGVWLEVAPDMVADYNRKYGRSCLPVTEYSFAADKVSIAAGRNVSETVEVFIEQELESGSFYCLPVRIASTDGDMDILEPSRVFYIVMRAPVRSKAVKIGAANMICVPTFAANPAFGGHDLKALPELTLECRVMVSAFQSSDPYISSIMGAEGQVCMRFGDVKIGKDVLQVCKGDYQPAVTASPCLTNTWYHVAAVWSRSSLRVYIDGRLQAETPHQGETVDIASVWLNNANSPSAGGMGFGLGAASIYNGNRPLDGYLAEARVWTRALSSAEIASNNDLVVVDPQSPDLLAYWHLDEAEKLSARYQDEYFRKYHNNRVPDATGHGYDAYGGSSAPSFVDTVW